MIISPDVRYDKDEIEKYVSVITSLLPKEYEVKETINKNGERVYSVLRKSEEGSDEDQYPINIHPNVIPFFVDDRPSEYPAFQIIIDNWDDFGYKTTFHLHYWDKMVCRHTIGAMKVLQEGEFLTKLPGRFLSLSSAYCSLGGATTIIRDLRI